MSAPGMITVICRKIGQVGSPSGPRCPTAPPAWPLRPIHPGRRPPPAASPPTMDAFSDHVRGVDGIALPAAVPFGSAAIARMEPLGPRSPATSRPHANTTPTIITRVTIEGRSKRSSGIPEHGDPPEKCGLSGQERSRRPWNGPVLPVQDEFGDGGQVLPLSAGNTCSRGVGPPVPAPKRKRPISQCKSGW